MRVAGAAATRARLSLCGAVFGLVVVTGCSKKEAAPPAAENAAAAPAAAQPAEAQPAAGEVAVGTKHACDLVSPARLKELIGFDPGAVHRVGPACMYDSGVNLQVNLPAVYDLARQTNEKAAGSVTEVAGLGDKAFFNNIGPTTDLHAVKGDTYFNVVVVKDMPEARRTELAKSIMQELLKASGK
ncbi:MAG TPA: hypothetical protein VF832_05040 [Longimicrobiales bacterium]